MNEVYPDFFQLHSRCKEPENCNCLEIKPDKIVGEPYEVDPKTINRIPFECDCSFWKILPIEPCLCGKDDQWRATFFRDYT